MNRFSLCLAAVVVAGVGVCADVLRASVYVGDSPTLQFKALGGERVDLSALRGKLVLVHFWDHWSTWGDREVLRANDDYGKKGLIVIGVSLDYNQTVATKTVEDRRYAWPQYFDGRGRQNPVAQEWGADGSGRAFLIGPDGTCLWEGWAGGLKDALQDAFEKHPPQLVNAKTLALAKTTLDQIDKLLEKGDTTGALKAMAKFPPEAKADDKIAERFSKAEDKLATASDEMIAQVDPLIDDHKFKEAAAKLQEMIKALSGTPVAAKARQKLNELANNPDAKAAMESAEKSRRSEESLAAAKKLQADKKDEAAYQRFKSIVKDFPDTPAADAAAAAVAEYEKDAAFVKKVNDGANATKAKSMLNMAESYRKSSRNDLAKKKYQEVIDQFPNTYFAETAKKALDEMKGS